jgi:hypothetical protein
LLSVTKKPIMLSVIMLSVIMLSVIMLSVIMLSVVMLRVVAPFASVTKKKNFIRLAPAEAALDGDL